MLISGGEDIRQHGLWGIQNYSASQWGGDETREHGAKRGLATGEDPYPNPNFLGILTSEPLHGVLEI